MFYGRLTSFCSHFQLPHCHRPCLGLCYLVSMSNKVELQWLEHLWDHGNLFEIWVVQSTEDSHGSRPESKRL